MSTVGGVMFRLLSVCVVLKGVVESMWVAIVFGVVVGVRVINVGNGGAVVVNGDANGDDGGDRVDIVSFDVVDGFWF